MKYVLNLYDRGSGGRGRSFEKLEQLKTALGQRYTEADFIFNHIDIDTKDNLTDYDDNLIEQIDDGDLGVPLLTVNDEIVQDGCIHVDAVIEWFRHKTGNG